MQPIFAVVTRGLEAIAAQELAALPGVAGCTPGYRRVMATCAGSLAPLLGLRTADDVFLDAATWPAIGHTRAALAQLHDLSRQPPWADLAERCATLRPISPSPSFSVTANFVGKRNYTSAEIKAALAAGIAQATGWSSTEDDAEAELNIRLFLEHATGYVGMRLGKLPLHRRPYKTEQLPGSLKPPVAAAMLWLARARPGASVVDPCCGAGTIMIEAALLGAHAAGGDIDGAAVGAAQANAAAAGVTVEARQWDARTLPLAAASADAVVCNLPWGRQVSVDHELAEFYREVCAEMRRLLKPGGRIVLLTRAPELVAFPDLRQEGEFEISLFGQNPRILVFAP